jgi:hypothetical protein
VVLERVLVVLAALLQRLLLVGRTALAAVGFTVERLGTAQ